MRLLTPASLAALVLLLAAVPAEAQWLPGGNPIGPVAGTYRGFTAAASGPDRVVVAWVRDAGLGHYEVRAQAWTAEGTLAAGWPRDGVLVTSFALARDPWDRGYVSLEICEDGAGGSFILAAPSTPYGGSRNGYLLRVSGSGSLAAGWAPEGLDLGASNNWELLGPDGAGGVFVAGKELGPDHYFATSIRRIDSAGNPAPGWPDAGLSIPYGYLPALIADAGGIYLSTIERDLVTQRWRGLVLRRLDGNAVPDPQWPSAGAELSRAIGANGTRLFPDGTGGVFAGWFETYSCDDSGCGGPYFEAMRVFRNGMPDQRWVAGPRAFTLAPDRTGGVLMGTIVDGQPCVVRFGNDGASMPGWAAQGSPAMTETVVPEQLKVAGDGRGGAFVTWGDTRTGSLRLYASRLDPSGRRAADWPATGSFIDPGRGLPKVIDVVPLRPDIAVVVWNEWTPSGATAYLTALRPGEPGPFHELRPVSEQVEFAIARVAPNPAHGVIAAAVELRNDGPAQLDLVDATGRVLESQDYAFQSQARGAVYFNRARSAPPGVYWLRLTQAHRVATRKVVVLE